jgi:hypothetical protein
MSAHASTLKSVVSLIRESSLSRLITLSRKQNILIREIETTPLVFAHWMSFILISGENLRIIFKAHFMTEAAIYFAEETYGNSKEVSLGRSLDFFREYCNLTAGQIKLELDQNNVKVGASLPGLIRGFDEVFYREQKGSTKILWQLGSNEIRFDCSAHIEVFKDFEIKKITNDEKADSGEVEFL